MNYYAKGYTPVYKFIELRSATAKAVWTPTTSTRIVLTALSFTSTNPVGTIQFRFGNVGGSVLYEFYVGSTAQIVSFSPNIDSIESLVYDRPLFAEVQSGATDGWRISAQGFEIE